MISSSELHLNNNSTTYCIKNEELTKIELLNDKLTILDIQKCSKLIDLTLKLNLLTDLKLYVSYKLTKLKLVIPSLRLLTLEILEDSDSADSDDSDDESIENPINYTLNKLGFQSNLSQLTILNSGHVDIKESYLKNLPNLTNLILENCGYMVSKILNNLTSSLKKLTNLTLLSCKIQNLILQNLTNLTHIHIHYCEIWNIKLENFAKLDNLKIEHCKGLDDIHLKNMTKLTTVTIYNCRNLTSVWLENISINAKYMYNIEQCDSLNSICFDNSKLK